MRFFYFLLLWLLWSCKSHEQINIDSIKNTCAYCDSLHGFKYPLRVIDKNIEGVLLVNKIDSAYRDSVRVLTKNEIQTIKDALFCFLGKNEAVVDRYFHPKMERVDFNNDKLGKTKIYIFNRGDYINTASSTYTVEDEKSKNTELWLLGSEQFELKFTMIGAEFIYTGTKYDSIRWNNYIGL